MFLVCVKNYSIKDISLCQFLQFFYFLFSGMPPRGACQALLFVIKSLGEPQRSEFTQTS